jgi:endonuclease/exonuclease/phosphatase family metal-dependent hydrolase
MRTTLLRLSLLLPIVVQSRPAATAEEQLNTLRQGRFGLAVPFPNPFKLLDWNIDRGVDNDAIRRTIRAENPDVCLFQEVDWNTLRTARRDVASDLAREFSMAYVLGLAFQELSQGTADSPAWQGQANLTRAAFQSSRIVRFQHQTSFWKPEPYLPSWFPQRRVGGRIALVSEIQSGSATLVFYNLHLESRGLGWDRYAQLKETLDDADGHYPSGPVILAGDLNTKYLPGKFTTLIQKHGFRNCFGDKRERTHHVYGDLDWIFVRGKASCEAPAVERQSEGSDHYPVTALIRVRP